MTGKRWLLQLTVLGTVIAMSTVACGGTSSSSNTSGGTVSISDEYGITWPCEFNPYNATVSYDSFGPIYEELVFMDSLKDGAATPWLATKWAWSNSDRTLTFTIRNGVKWSDGKPFSAKDVVFTFNLLKKYPSLDLNSDWSVLSSVALSGSDQVVFNFKTGAVPYFYYIADETPIVPEHIWASIKNPVTYLDKTPVGTGPYTMSACSSANIQYKKNPNYWQPGLPKIETVNFPSYLNNNTANADLKNGTDQWGSQFMPSIKSYYIDANPKYYHYWFEPVYNVMIWPNLTDPQLTLPVREAISYAINRDEVSKIGEYGYEPASNQTDIVKPTFASWYDSSEASKYGNAYSYDQAKAISILTAAGYRRGSNGIFAKNGKSLSFTIINNGGFSDWVASVSVIQSELKAVGIQITPDNLSNTTFDTDIYTGHYQLAYDWDSGGPTPYYELRAILYSPNTAPVGKTAVSNYERYSSKSTDALIEQYASTTSAAIQHQVVDELQQVMLSDVPVIPVTEAVDWYQYDTQHIGGWVTPSNPYAQPNQYAVPDWGVFLLHLYEK
ncbi:MAG TPA: ABC transporter substrate-binding protein [Streptosporangiaceae bacterium]|nr:ABC transporter substrate-binding protein [Streptosporangiaceae bacterium]